MHILIAPNAFKNSLTADQVAAAILNGLQQSRLRFTAECFPVGDGGDGTADLLISRLGATKIEATARDPIGRERPSWFGLTKDGETAIIEMANASGLRLLEPHELDPLHTTTHGTGDLILAALDRRPRRILIGMGGSATVDAGIGILEALGARFLDKDNNPLHDPAALINLASIDTATLDPRLRDTEITILTDVDNPLLGPNGAAAVFGPQKGAGPKAVQQLEKALQTFADIIHRQKGIDLATLSKAGTAGGAAAGLHALLGAHLVDGIETFLEITNFDKALDQSDWVITGEGSIDEQTLRGKGPFGVASHAKQKNLPVIGLAGKLPLQKVPGLDRYFDLLFPINHEALPLLEAIPRTADNLIAAGRTLGNFISRLPGHQ